MIYTEKIDKSVKAKSVGMIGMICNFILLCLKFVTGFLFSSHALMADAINSFGDVFSSLVTFIGGKIASKPEDSKHEFGHGKAEFIASFLIGIFMIIVSVDTLKGSIESIYYAEKFSKSIFLIIVPIFTIIIKLSMYIYVLRIARNTKSLLINANADDHKNDIILSFGVLIGILSGYFGMYYIDGIVGIIISFVIMITGVKITKEAYEILIDKCIDTTELDKIKGEILKFEGIRHIDSIKSKPTGNTHMIILKISVDPNMSVKTSHKIAGQIRERLRENELVYDTVVHINPDDEEVD